MKTIHSPKQLLAYHGLEPKKSLGQNFLADDHILAEISSAADLRAGDQVLEIGPGLGALTVHLAQTAGRVVAIELDDRLLPILQAVLHNDTNVLVVHGDILAQDPAGWFANHSYKVIANVPYYITAAILRHLLSGRAKPQLMVLTVQKEVAERLTARPGDLSLLAMSVQLYGQARIVGEIKAGAFWPRPDVDSAIIRIDLHPTPLLPMAEEKSFFRLLKTGFSQKRKQLQKNLRGLAGLRPEQIPPLLAQANLDGQRRAETLTIEEWLTLHKLINPPPATETE